MQLSNKTLNITGGTGSFVPLKRLNTIVKKYEFQSREEAG